MQCVRPDCDTDPTCFFPLTNLQANKKTASESQKTDLERKLSSELIATKGKHSKTIDELQVRLEDAGE